MKTQGKTHISSVWHPPVVTVLGHVDHGKTTLLDTIRKTNVAQKEAGGITQRIGAYQIVFQDKPITFLDTPGHEAFARMRARGSTVADIAILVVAGNDGVQPQTVESLELIRTAHIPFIVAINKIDLPNSSGEKVKKQLTALGVSFEEYGGDTPVLPISAKNGQGIEKLLEMILLLSELFPRTVNAHDAFKGVVIESLLSKTKGSTATVVVKNGTLSQGDTIWHEHQAMRVRALLNTYGKPQPSIGIGDAAEILGWPHPPAVGSIVTASAPAVTTKPTQNSSVPVPIPMSFPSPQEKKIRILLKTDTAGSLEAITQWIKDHMEEKLEIIRAQVGNISESDILLAKTTKSIIIGFNLPVSLDVERLASAEKVLIKTYGIIYELFEEIDEVVEAIRSGNLVKQFGVATVIATFPVKKDVIIGVRVIEGRIARGDQIRIMRGTTEVGRAKITSLRHKKDDISRAEQGTEAGLILSQNLSLLTGDSIISIG